MIEIMNALDLLKERGFVKQITFEDELYKAFDAAVEANVAFVPGTHFYPDGGHLNTMRLNFSMCDVPTIEKGMERLAGVLAKL